MSDVIELAKQLKLAIEEYNFANEDSIVAVSVMRNSLINVHIDDYVKPDDVGVSVSDSEFFQHCTVIKDGVEFVSLYKRV